MGHEMTPTGRTTPFGRGRNAMASQDGGDGFVAQLDAEFGEFACDLEVAPASIFACQSHNEPFNVPAGSGTTALIMALTGPFAAH